MGAGVSKKGTVVPRTIHVEEKRLDDPIASATPNPGDPSLSSGEEVKENDGGGDDDDGTADCGGCGRSSGSAAAAPAPAALPPPHAPKPKGGKGGDRLTSAKSAPAVSFRTQRYSSVSALSGQPMPSWLLQQQQQAAAAGAAGGTARVPSPALSEGSTEFDTMAHAGLARCKRLILVRHGQSEGNVDSEKYRTTGDSFLHLTEKGWRQAVLAGALMRDTYIGDETVHFVVSPYLRTLETFHGIAETWGGVDQVSSTEDPRIREQDFGNFQDPEKMNDCKAERLRFGTFWYRFPNGESGADVYDRVSTFLPSLWRLFEQVPAENFVIVTHGVAIRVFLMRYLKMDCGTFEKIENPSNCEMFVLERGDAACRRGARDLADGGECGGTIGEDDDGWGGAGAGGSGLGDADGGRDAGVHFRFMESMRPVLGDSAAAAVAGSEGFGGSDSTAVAATAADDDGAVRDTPLSGAAAVVVETVVGRGEVFHELRNKPPKYCSPERELKRGGESRAHILRN